MLSVRHACTVLLLLPVSALLGGCRFTNHAYRLDAPVVELAPPSVPGASAPQSASFASGVHCNASSGYADIRRPCLAFIEFDDSGAPFGGNAGANTEIKAAVDLIERTRTQFPDKTNRSPIVLLFVHGWKHNAGLRDANVLAFENVLRYLAGQRVSQVSEDTACTADSDLADETKRMVVGRCIFAKHPVIGIYIGWRGDLVNKYFPVLQDASFYDRELAAHRVGSSNALTSAISAISAATRQRNADPRGDKPILILTGHSFGGLVLERAVSQAFTAQLDHPQPDGTVSPLADLVLLVNPASSSEGSWKMIDVLAAKQAQHTFEAPGGVAPGERPEPRPLFLSISTPADAATGLALPAGRSVETIPQVLAGGFQTNQPLACFDPLAPGSQTGSTLHWEYPYTLKSAPHLESLQSHELIELVDADGRSLSRCPTSRLTPSSPPPPVPPVGSYFIGSIPGRCFVVQPRPGRCNGTPYWVMQTNRDLIPDHGTIFTARFLNFVGRFLPPPTDPDAAESFNAAGVAQPSNAADAATSPASPSGEKKPTKSPRLLLRVSPKPAQAGPANSP